MKKALGHTEGKEVKKMEKKTRSELIEIFVHLAVVIAIVSAVAIS